jgi:hypothetical protein
MRERSTKEVRTEVIEDDGVTIPLVIPRQRGSSGSKTSMLCRKQLRKLTQATITATGKRIPGLKLDNPRQLAVMHTLT